jgi:homoserine O-succinyltransferase
MDAFVSEMPDDLPARDVVIGIANIMPAKGRRAASEQFAGLLDAASKACNIRIKYFAPSSTVPEAGLPFCDEGPYESLDTIHHHHLDGLIVTGLEPRASSITDEPFWADLARLTDWAADNTISTIWSCFAAHAAVFRLDRLHRRRFRTKLSGVFHCANACEHWLLSDAPAHWTVPHSRCNDLSQDALVTAGYEILSCGPQIGVDTFVKHQGKSLFMFFQGHPEYGPEALLREYRRDIRRFLLAQRHDYPEMPQNYFGRETEKELAALRCQALRQPTIAVLAEFDSVLRRPLEHVWHEPAIRLYAKWLSYLSDRKAEPTGLAPSRNDLKLAYQ